MRGFSNYTHIDSRSLYAGDISENNDEWQKIMVAAGRRETIPSYLLAHKGTAEKERVRRPAFTIGLVDAAMDYLSEIGVEVKVILIDYLQRLRSDIGRTQRKDIADEISGGAKDIALKYSASVVIASQLGRQVDQRVPPLPRESDYKESGNIEEDADVSMSIFYPMKYYQEGDIIDGTDRNAAPNQVFIQIHKQRGGDSNVGDWFYFDPRFAMFADLE